MSEGQTVLPNPLRFCEILAQNYAPGAAAPGTAAPGAAAPGAYLDMLLEHCAF